MKVYVVFEWSGLEMPDIVGAFLHKNKAQVAAAHLHGKRRWLKEVELDARLPVYLVEEGEFEDRKIVAAQSEKKNALWMAEQHRSWGKRRVITIETDDEPVNPKLRHYLVNIYVLDSDLWRYPDCKSPCGGKVLTTHDEIVRACEDYGLPEVVLEDDAPEAELVVRSGSIAGMPGMVDWCYTTIVLAESAAEAQSIARARVLASIMKERAAREAET